MLSNHAVICLNAIMCEEERQNVIDELTNPDLNFKTHEIIELNHEESSNMCANMFDVMDENGNHVVVMSQ